MTERHSDHHRDHQSSGTCEPARFGFKHFQELWYEEALVSHKDLVSDIELTLDPVPPSHATVRYLVLYHGKELDLSDYPDVWIPYALTPHTSLSVGVEVTGLTRSETSVCYRLECIFRLHRSNYQGLQDLPLALQLAGTRESLYAYVYMGQLAFVLEAPPVTHQVSLTEMKATSPSWNLLGPDLKDRYPKAPLPAQWYERCYGLTGDGIVGECLAALSKTDDVAQRFTRTVVTRYPPYIVTLMNQDLQLQTALKLTLCNYGWREYRSRASGCHGLVHRLSIALDNSNLVQCYHGELKGHGQETEHLSVGEAVFQYRLYTGFRDSVREGLITHRQPLEETFVMEDDMEYATLIIIPLHCRECIFHIQNVCVTQHIEVLAFNPKLLTERPPDLHRVDNFMRLMTPTFDHRTHVLEWGDYLCLDGTVHHKNSRHGRAFLKYREEQEQVTKCVAFHVGQRPVFMLK